MNEDLRIDRLRWWHLPEVARMETAIFGPEAWSEGLLWTELSAGNDYRAVFDRSGLDAAARTNPDRASTADRLVSGATGSGRAVADGSAPEGIAPEGIAPGGPALADREPRIAGYVGVALGDTEAWINNIAVDAAYRRRGVARMLMDDALARARAAGAKALYLEVAVDNVPAQRLYDAYGFYGIGVRKNYYQHTGTDAAVMRMDL